MNAGKQHAHAAAALPHADRRLEMDFAPGPPTSAGLQDYSSKRLRGRAGPRRKLYPASRPQPLPLAAAKALEREAQQRPLGRRRGVDKVQSQATQTRQRAALRVRGDTARMLAPSG